MRGYFKKKVFIILLAMIFILPVIPVGATPATRDRLNELRRQQEAAGQLVSDQQNLLDGTEFEMSRVMAEIQELDQQITNASEKLEAIEIDLLSTEIRLAEAEEDLAIARAEREQQIEILRERLRVMHEQGTVGLLEVLFQAESIADFFSGWEYIRIAAQFDRDLLERLESTEQRVNSNLEILSANSILIRDLAAQVEDAKHEINNRMHEREMFFAALYEDAERHAEFLAMLEEEARIIDLEFGIVHTVYRAEVAEAERIAREERERRQAEEAAARAAAQAEKMATLNSFESFAWPLPIQGVTIEGGFFGYRADPFTGRRSFHTGIDISAPGGTHIFAAESGYVRFARWSAGWGNYIIIDHADGYSTMYAHNSRNRVTEGQRVTRGQHIADVGTTGRSTGNHLHFEVRRNGVHLDPMAFFR